MVIANWLLRVIGTATAVFVCTSLLLTGQGIPRGTVLLYVAGLPLPLYALWTSMRQPPTAGRITIGLGLSLLYAVFFAITRILDEFP